MAKNVRFMTGVKQTIVIDNNVHFSEKIAWKIIIPMIYAQMTVITYA